MDKCLLTLCCVISKIIGSSSPAFSSSRCSPYSLISVFSCYKEGVSLGFSCSCSCVVLLDRSHCWGKRWEKSKRQNIWFPPRHFGDHQVDFSCFSSGFRCSPHCHHELCRLVTAAPLRDRLAGRERVEKEEGAVSTLWPLEAYFPGPLVRKAGFLSDFWGFSCYAFPLWVPLWVKIRRQ